MATPVKYVILEKNPDYHELKIKEYFHDQTPYEYFKRWTLPLYGPAFAGLFIGNAIGGPPTAIVGTGIGIMGGAYITRQITESNFEEWKNLNVESKVFQEFYENNINLEKLKELRCPITQHLISDPVKTPFGDYYERKALEEYASVCPNGIIKDPQGKGTYTLNDLVDAPEYTIRMKNVFKILLHNERITKQLSPDVSTGLGLIVADLSNQVTNYVFRQTNMLLDQLHKRHITLEQYNARISILTKITSED